MITTLLSLAGLNWESCSGGRSAASSDLEGTNQCIALLRLLFSRAKDTLIIKSALIFFWKSDLFFNVSGGRSYIETMAKIGQSLN